jgi:folate-binding protein YgfZ
VNDDANRATTEAPIAGVFIDEPARDRITVSGPDARTYLHSQVAQDVEVMEVGDLRWTFVLDPTGKVVSLARLTRSSDDVFELDTDAGYGDVLAERLRRFKIRVDADIALVAATVDAADLPSPEAEIARVAMGWPRMGAEIMPGETIPAATGVTAVAASFTKGCYPGQELIERMDSRGAEAPRSLRVIDVAVDARPGDPVLDDAGTIIGEITSVAGTKAIASVRRGATPGSPPTKP